MRRKAAAGVSANCGSEERLLDADARGDFVGRSLDADECAEVGGHRSDVPPPSILGTRSQIASGRACPCAERSCARPMQSGVRHCPKNAGVDTGSWAAPRKVRTRRRLASRRMRNRGAPGRPALGRSKKARRGAGTQRRLHSCECPKRLDRILRRVSESVGRSDGKRHAGGDARERHDRHQERGARAGNPGSGLLPPLNGSEDRRRRDE